MDNTSYFLLFSDVIYPNISLAVIFSGKNSFNHIDKFRLFMIYVFIDIFECVCGCICKSKLFFYHNEFQIL
jgi:hypothetical protein